MNEQAQKVLSDLLSRAINGLDAAVTFSQAQIPDVIKQLLMWNAVSSGLLQLLGMLMIAGSFLLFRLVRLQRKSGAEWTNLWGNKAITSVEYDLLSGLVPILVACIGFLMVTLNFDWLKIWLAPKLFLLEYAASLVK